LAALAVQHYICCQTREIVNLKNGYTAHLVIFYFTNRIKGIKLFNVSVLQLYAPSVTNAFCVVTMANLFIPSYDSGRHYHGQK
jgi:hypothetical protein